MPTPDERTAVRNYLRNWAAPPDFPLGAILEAYDQIDDLERIVGVLVAACQRALPPRNTTLTYWSHGEEIETQIKDAIAAAEAAGVKSAEASDANED